MAKPKLVIKPKRVTLYLPEETVVRGRYVATLSGTSLSQLVTSLINSKANDGRKIRVHADFLAEEYADIEAEATLAGQTIEDFIRTATYRLLDGDDDGSTY